MNHKNIVCPYCKLKFGRWANLKKHIENIHPDEEVPLFVLNETVYKRRQGQIRADGTKAEPKKRCPTCLEQRKKVEYLKTCWVIENKKWLRVGLCCPDPECDYIVKGIEHAEKVPALEERVRGLEEKIRELEGDENNG